MRALSFKDTERYLSILHGLKGSFHFYDSHVHPYEVLFDRFQYQPDPTRSGVWSIPGASYAAPSLAALRFPEMGELNEDDPRSQRLREISVMLLRRVYGSVGPRVFLDQMALSSIDRVLLLPVAAETASTDQLAARMAWVAESYPDRERYWLAGSVPPLVSAAELASYVAGLRRQFGIRALKCHPVVSGMDVGSPKWRNWLEALLVACRDNRLPLVLHGGRNNPYWGGSRGNFASIENWAGIDFSLSSEAVILAHAGFHRCRASEVERSGLPVLHRMLESHPNLSVDLSGLELDALKLVLAAVPGERILFGSDALYAQQWEAVGLVLHALRELQMDLEVCFIQFANINPKRTLFKEASHVQQYQDSMEPVFGGSPGEVVP